MVWETEVVVATSLAAVTSHLIIHFNHKLLQIPTYKIHLVLYTVFFHLILVSTNMQKCKEHHSYL